MKILQDSDSEKFISEAIAQAKKATCSRSKCGSVIVMGGEIIGRGFNSPTRDLESQRRCSSEKSSYNKKVTDKTCCIHAEQRAIFDALKNNPDKIFGSNLYFIRLDKSEKPSFSGKPYCTICSKMALDLGIKNFILSRESGLTAYDTEEYNKLSYEYSNE
jgi:deoxycytidylate deaminase